MSLSAQDYEKILGIIDTAHTHLDRAVMFEAVCKGLEEIVGLSGSAFIPVDSLTGRFCFPAHLAYNTSKNSLVMFCMYHAPLNSTIGVELNKYANRPVLVNDIIPESGMAEAAYGYESDFATSLYYEFCCPLNSHGRLLGVMVFSRKDSGREFSDRDREMLNIFLPHLARAFHNCDLINAVSSSLETGVIVVGEDDRPLYINEAAAYCQQEPDKEDP